MKACIHTVLRDPAGQRTAALDCKDQLASCGGERQQRKEVKTMKYEKPNLVVLSAGDAIQHSAAGKLAPTQVEGSSFGTPNAYEADE